jgi:hypothetical protein
MKVFVQILLFFFIILTFGTFGACSGDKEDQNEPKVENDSKAKSDHLYRPQFDAFEKAKKVEKNLQDAYDARLKGIEEKVEDNDN